MKAGELHDRMAARPFRPFTIETVNGQSFEITGEECLLLPKPKPEIAIVFVESHMYIIDIDSITVLAIRSSVVEPKNMHGPRVTWDTKKSD